MSRVMGRSGIKVSEVGFGCLAIGGPFTDSTSGGIPAGWRGRRVTGTWGDEEDLPDRGGGLAGIGVQGPRW